MKFAWEIVLFSLGLAKFFNLQRGKHHDIFPKTNELSFIGINALS